MLDDAYYDGMDCNDDKMCWHSYRINKHDTVVAEYVAEIELSSVAVDFWYYFCYYLWLNWNELTGERLMKLSYYYLNCCLQHLMNCCCYWLMPSTNYF